MEPAPGPETQRPNCYISTVSVEGLWGRSKPLTIELDPRVNILIGPNASGKTTLLNLIRSVVQVDVLGMLDVVFSQITVRLRDYQGSFTKQIKVIPGERRLDFYISTKKISIPIDPYASERYSPRMIRQRIAAQRQSCAEELSRFARLVWLPVTRRLPISEEDQDERYVSPRGAPPIESVDHRLTQLLQDLGRFRFSLDAQLAEEYKQFEREVLSTFLYDKRHDRFALSKLEQYLPTSQEREQLMAAFDAAGLLNPAMRQRISEHFSEATAAVNRLKTQEGATEGFNLDDALFLPLMSRTKAMVDLARKLELRRNEIFAALQKFLSTTESFFADKRVQMALGGDLAISARGDGKPIRTQQLSSGEKQVLILLIQALLKDGQPSIYVADEPELSLHVVWQERLLTSLLELGGISQIIVATHSPDIVGPFQDKVLDLSKA